MKKQQLTLLPKYNGKCFLNVKKKSYPTVQSAYGGDFQERSEKKKIPQLNLSQVSVMQGENLVFSSALSNFAG